MVSLFLKQMWMVLSLNHRAQTVVSGKKPTQEIGMGQGCLAWLSLLLNVKPQPEGLPVVLKIKGFLCHPA